MRRAAALSAALALLGAAAAKAGEPVNRWAVNLGDSRPQLVFGEPGSDVLWFGLHCRPGEGRVAVTDFAPLEGETGPLTLVSGRARATLKLKQDVSDDPDSARSATLPIDSPVLAAFRTTGRLGAPQAQDGYSAVTAAERAKISRFFAACQATA